MRCLPLLHDYRVTGARAVRVETDEGDYSGTYVLRVCARCGRPRTNTVKGTWSLGELTAESEAPDA